MNNKLSALLKFINDAICDINESTFGNPFYGKEIYFFEGCVEPILNRNQLMGYIGVFSGNNKELSSKMNFAILPTNSWRNLRHQNMDRNLELLVEKLGINEDGKFKNRNYLPNTIILPEPIFFKKVHTFILGDSVKLNQFNKVNFNNTFSDEF